VRGFKKMFHFPPILLISSSKYIGTVALIRPPADGDSEIPIEGWPVARRKCILARSGYRFCAGSSATQRRRLVVTRVPRSQFTLLFALLVIALLAVYIARFRQMAILRHPVSTVVVEALDGDEKSLARDLIGEAVLDDALNRTIRTGRISRLPRFAGAIDPRAELRGSLLVESNPRSHTVQLSITDGPKSMGDELEILTAVGAASVIVLGKNRVAMGEYKISNGSSLFELLFVVVLVLALRVCLHRHMRWRRKRPSASLPS
jgi:hypothetical protein